MSSNIVGLGKEGAISDIDIKIDYLMCSFFFAKHSQSILYRGKISSLTKVIQLYGDDDLTISSELQSELQSFLNKFFTTAMVTVSVEETTDNSPGIRLKVDAVVSDTTSTSPSSTSVGYSLTTRESALKAIVNSLSGEEIYSA